MTMEICALSVTSLVWADGWRQMETTWCVTAVRPAVVSRDGKGGRRRQMSVRFTGATLQSHLGRNPEDRLDMAAFVLLFTCVDLFWVNCPDNRLLKWLPRVFSFSPWNAIRFSTTRTVGGQSQSGCDPAGGEHPRAPS